MIVDLNNSEDIPKIISTAIDSFGKIDVLVNNAAAGGLVPIQAEDAVERFDKILQTNLRSVIELTRLVIPHLAQTKGCIVNISCVASTKPVEDERHFQLLPIDYIHFSSIITYGATA